MLMCVVCGREYLESETDKCSERCVQGELAAEEIAQHLVELPKNPDERIFFYDVGFGDLADRLTVLILRRLHQRSLNDQLETDFHINRVRTALGTKINRLAVNRVVREGLGDLIRQLYGVNATLWRLRSRAMSTTLPHDECVKASFEYFLRLRNRDRIRQELDIVVDGRARNPRVY